MKTSIIIMVALFLGYIIFYNKRSKKDNSNHSMEQISEHLIPKPKHPLRLVFEQDVSGSIKWNGVELISSSVFSPLFADIGRSIEINFGCISKSSAGKLITIELFAAEFKNPTLPDLHDASITEKRKLKGQYLEELKQYQADSTRYFDERNGSIFKFCKKVDSLIATYYKKLASETDIETAVTVADKVFSFPTYNYAENVLILNSDGIDSYGHTVQKMKNIATVILVNADGKNKSSVDKITTTTLESPEQAIQLVSNN